MANLVVNSTFNFSPHKLVYVKLHIEICLDGTNGETIALRDINGLTVSKKEQKILKQWAAVLQ